MERYSEQFNSIVNENLGWVHQNKYVLPVLSLFLGVYVALARPVLPNFVAKLFENPVFRLLMISYIIYRGNKDPQLSLMIAAAFLITIHMLNKQKVEQFANNAERGLVQGIFGNSHSQVNSTYAIVNTQTQANTVQDIMNNNAQNTVSNNTQVQSNINDESILDNQYHPAENVLGNDPEARAEGIFNNDTFTM